MPRGTVCIGDAINWDSSLNRGLVSWWIALPDQQRGNVFRDLTLRNNGVLTNGPTWQGPLGRPGGYGSLNFVAASSQYADIGNPNSLVISTGNATLSALVKASVSAGDGTGILSFGNAVVTRLLCIEQTTMGLPRLELYDGTNNPFTTGTSVISDLGWCLVTGVRDSGTLRIYVNGAEEGNAVDTAVNVSGGASQIWTIGRRMDARYFSGNIDHVQVWNRALSPAEVRAVYLESRAGNPLTLNRVRPYTVFDMGGAPPGGSILSQMLNNGLFVGSAA